MAVSENWEDLDPQLKSGLNLTSTEGQEEFEEAVPCPPELPNGLWDQRRQLLERRLKGKKGRTGEFRSPLGRLSEEPVIKIYNKEEGSFVFVKRIKIIPLKIGNRNLPKEPIIVVEQDECMDTCLNKAWERITQEWGTYWNPPAPGTPGCTVLVV